MVAEEYCWAITQAGGQPFCGRSDTSALESVFRLDSLVRKYTGDHMHTQFRDALRLPELNYSLSRAVSVKLLSVGNVEVKPHIKRPEHYKKVKRLASHSVLFILRETGTHLMAAQSA